LTPRRGAEGGTGVAAPQPRPWLASTTRAGLARPPIPQGGLGVRLSVVGGSLTPPAAVAGGSARPGSRLESRNPRPTLSEPGGFHLVDAVARIDWFGDR